MKASTYSVVVIMQVLYFQFAKSTKLWLPRVDFMDTSNWIAAELPFARQTIFFPSKLNALVELPADIVTVSSLILPHQGALIMPEKSFSLNIHTTESTEISVAQFKAPGRTPYYSGSNWASYDEQRSFLQIPNAAVPHIERIPCQYETALFDMSKRGMPKPIDMQYHESIVVDHINIKGTIEGIENVQTFMLSQLGQLLFYNAEDTLILQGKCTNAEKCPCQQPQQMSAICSNERCSTPHCVSPILPAGHCCPLCGSVFRMNMATLQGVFSLRSFAYKLNRKISSTDTDSSNIEYHLGIDRSEGEDVLQFIVVDKGEYGEKCIQLLNALRPFFEQQFSSGFHILHAGQPHTPVEGEQVLAFFLLTLIATTIFFSVLYAYYYDTTLIPRLRATMRDRQFFFTPFVFARFDPKSDDDELSVDVNFANQLRHEPDNEERVNTAIDLIDVEKLHTSSFDNPMYENPSASTDRQNVSISAAAPLTDVELQTRH